MRQTINQIKWGSILSYVQMGLNIIIGLIYTPLMIRLLGQSEYGLYNTVASTISSLSILSLGFNSSYIRYYSKYKKENDEEGINNLNGLFIIIFLIIGIIAFACGLFLSFNLNLVFSDGLTQREYQIAKVLMLLLTINLSVAFPMSVFINIISAYERFVFLKISGMIRTVAAPLIIIPLLYLGFKSIGIVVVTVILSFIVDCLYVWYVFFELHCKFKFDHLEFKLFKDILIFSSFIAINIIVDQINTNIDKILLGRFKGTSEVAIYSVGASLNAYYTLFSTSVSGVFTPRIHKIINEYNHDKIELRSRVSDLFIRVGRIQYAILGLILSGIIFFGMPFIVNIWAGKGYEASYYVTLLLVIPATIPLIQNLGIEIQRALNLHQFRSIVYMIMALMNLIASIYLCQLFGAIGSAIGTAIAVLIANGLIMNIFYHKRCYIDIISFWKNIIKMSRGIIIPIVVGIVMISFINLNNRLLLLLCICTYGVIYCISMWFLGINEYEKDLIKKPAAKLFKRIKGLKN